MRGHHEPARGLALKAFDFGEGALMSPWLHRVTQSPLRRTRTLKLGSPRAGLRPQLGAGQALRPATPQGFSPAGQTGPFLAAEPPLLSWALLGSAMPRAESWRSRGDAPLLPSQSPAELSWCLEATGLPTQRVVPPNTTALRKGPWGSTKPQPQRPSTGSPLGCARPLESCPCPGAGSGTKPRASFVP